MNENFDIYSNRYGFYAVPHEFHMRVVPKILANGKVYEPETLAFICANVGDGDVITGGAFVGDFLPAISRALAPGACVRTFEPNPLSYEACCMTIKLNRLENVSLSAVAVGAQAARMPLRVQDFRKDEPAAAQSALTPGADLSTGGLVSVEVVTIDSLAPKERPVSILHLDVEKFEGRALRGATETIHRWKPILIVEGRRISRDWLEKHFPSCNYELAGNWEGNQFMVSSAR